MVYDKDKIKRLIEYKDEIIDTEIKNDLEWIIESYNEYFINSREYEEEKRAYRCLIKKYYDAEDTKASLKEELDLMKRKYKVLKCKFNDCCKNLKSMI